MDPKSLYDHLISLSSHSSVEDKHWGFDLVVARQCLSRVRATIRWAPTDKQLADALTKVCVTTMDMLRSCLKQGECQLSPEQTMLQRAADEGDRRKRDRCQQKTNKMNNMSGSHQEQQCLNHNRVGAMSQWPFSARVAIQSAPRWCGFRPWVQMRRSEAFFESLTNMQPNRCTCQMTLSLKPLWVGSLREARYCWGDGRIGVLEFGVTEEGLQELRNKRDPENDTSGVLKTDMTLHDCNEKPVLTNAPVLTSGQCMSVLKSLGQTSVWSLNRYAVSYHL